MNRNTLLASLLVTLPMAMAAQTTHLVETGGSSLGPTLPYYSPNVLNIQVGDVDAASASMSQLLEVYPRSVFSERSMWLVGQELIEAKETLEQRVMERTQELSQQVAAKAPAPAAAPIVDDDPLSRRIAAAGQVYAEVVAGMQGTKP